MSLPPAALIVAHDAGAAEILAAWVKTPHGQVWDLSYLLFGPAAAVFARKCQVTSSLTLDQARQDLRRFSWVLTGSSWGSDLERDTLRAAREHGVRSTTYLDHWCLYAQRFQSPRGEILPDEFWVGDEHALRLAREVFVGSEVHLKPNPYFAEAAREIAGLSASEPRSEASRHEETRILYVAEPVSEASVAAGQSALQFGYDEFGALRGYLEHLTRQGPPVTSRMRIRLRPHPAERAGKYDAVLAEFAGRLALDPSRSSTLAQDIAWSDWVVGCESMAMVIGLIGGRRVFSSIPAGGAPMVLPHPEIVRLF